MRLKKFIPLLFALILPLAKAQVSNPSVRYVTSAPSGACSASPPIQIVRSTGTVYTCNNGTWAATGGGSSGTSVSQNSGAAETSLAVTGFMSQVCSDSSGSGTVQSCTVANSFTPQTGNCVVYKTTTANSGTGLTVNVNSLGAKSVAVASSSGWTTTLVASSSIPANKPMNLCYDGTNWNASGTGFIPSGGSGGYTNITSSVTPTGCTITSGVCTTTGTVASVTLASIPGTYTHLRIVVFGTSPAASLLTCQYNGDTGSNYAAIANSAAGNSATSASLNQASQTSAWCGTLGTVIGGGTIDIPFYTSTTLPKIALYSGSIFTSSSSSTNNGDWRISTFWNGTVAAITSIKFLDASNISSGTSFMVYGGN